MTGNEMHFTDIIPRAFLHYKGKKGRVLPLLSRHGDAAEAVQASGSQPIPENAEGGFSAAVYSAGGGLFC